MIESPGKDFLRIVKRGASVSLLAKSGAKLAAFVMALVLARNLSVADYGAFTLVSTWLLFFVIVSVGGLDTAAMRYVAQFAEESDAHRKIASFVAWSRRRVFISSCLVAALAYGATTVFGLKLGDVNDPLVLTAAFVLPFLALTQFEQFVLRAQRQVGRADMIGQIIRTVVVIVVIVVIGRIHPGITGVHAMLAFLAGTIISLMVAEYWLRQSALSVAASAVAREEASTWRATAWPMLLITGSHFLLHQLDILMLGALTDSSRVAPYAVASRLADVVAFALVVASGIVAPMISSLYHAGRAQDLRVMLQLAGRWVSFVSLIVAVLVGIGRTPLLSMFGLEYVDAQDVLLILVAGQLINAFAGPVGFLLSMTGHQQGSARILGAGVLLNAMLNLWLIPLYQELGAAIATASTTVFWNLGMTIYAHRKIGLRATPL